MKNTLTINHLNSGSVDLLSRIDSGTNQLRLEVIGGKGSQITFNTGSIVTVLSDRFIYEINSNVWTGSGNLTFTISDLNISYTFTIVKVSDTDGNIMLKKITEYKYSLVKYESIYDNINGLRQQVNNNTQNITGLEHSKQDVLTPGENISIENNVISAKDTTYTAGDNIDITDNVISVKDIDEGTHLLYGLEEPNLNDGDNGDIYLKIKDDGTYYPYSSYITMSYDSSEVWASDYCTKNEDDSYNIKISGIPTSDNEYVAYKIEGLEEGVLYKFEYDYKISSGQFYNQFTNGIIFLDSPNHAEMPDYPSQIVTPGWYSEYRIQRTNNDANEHHYTNSFIATSDTMYFETLTSDIKDGVSRSIEIKNISVDRAVIGIDKVYYKITGVWLEDKRYDAISKLSDVNLNNLSDGQTLIYDSNSGKWINANGSGGSSVTIDTTERLIGTYMGEPMYQKVFELSSNVTLNTTAKIMDSYADFTMIKQPINVTALYDVSPEEQTIPILFFKYNSHIYAQAQTTAYTNKILAIYTKTTD